ncbi:MAG: hypothetical protein JO235_18615, partial [Chroococcidiopsidaceae cyanobacterium CP_BM_RX_35]|nr:hypothetical protein [Chroococcidiopsidaceae cyanobacterium CP_BM_RX_35]
MKGKKLLASRLPLVSLWHQHPNRQLESAWNTAQLGVLLLPLFPVPGILVLCWACVQTWRQQYRLIIRRPLNWGLAVFSLWLIVTASFA